MSIEAMKQALEALKMCRGLIRNNIADGVAISSPNPFFSADVDAAITTLRAAIEQAEKQAPVAVYGYCPFCGGEGVARERHPFGNDRCVNGHKYKSIDALTTPPAAPVQEPPPECQTDAEKRAYAFGWWKAMEYVRQNGVVK